MLASMLKGGFVCSLCQCRPAACDTFLRLPVHLLIIRPSSTGKKSGWAVGETVFKSVTMPVTGLSLLVLFRRGASFPSKYESKRYPQMLPSNFCRNSQRPNNYYPSGHLLLIPRSTIPAAQQTPQPALRKFFSRSAKRGGCQKLCLKNRTPNLPGPAGGY